MRWNLTNRSLPCRILFALLFLAAQTAQAQEVGAYVSGTDTITYSYTPLKQASIRHNNGRKPLLHRVVDYFERAAVDRTFEKKIDVTFVGGPSYSKNTSLGAAVMAAGLYRLDRTDSITSPSDVSVFANVSITGVYAVGISGNNIFRRNSGKLDYKLMFSSKPLDAWGVGYLDGRYNPTGEYTEKQYSVRTRYLHRVLPYTYVGALVNFEHTRAKNLDALSEKYLYGERERYTSTGLGAIVEYDSRDFIPNPFSGIYASVQCTWFPEALGSCGRQLMRWNITADYYRKVWRGGILACDLFGEFNSEGTPWPMLAHMGGMQRMRGYYQGQYTDRNMITLQMELRQNIWRRIGATIWCGAGNVFRDISSFEWSHTLPNYGIGLRWELKKRVNVRVDYGFGKGTSGLVLALNEAF